MTHNSNRGERGRWRERWRERAERRVREGGREGKREGGKKQRERERGEAERVQILTAKGQRGRGMEH